MFYIESALVPLSSNTHSALQSHESQAQEQRAVVLLSLFSQHQGLFKIADFGVSNWIPRSSGAPKQTICGTEGPHAMQHVQRVMHPLLCACAVTYVVFRISFLAHCTGWTAPEVLTGQPQSAKSDLYSIGRTLLRFFEFFGGAPQVEHAW